MQDNLKPYPQYKNSDVSWIGNIPNDWIILRNKYFLSELNIHSITGDEELLTVSQYTGITKRRDRLTEKTDLITTASTLEGYKIVEKGTMVMNIMLAWNGSLGVSEFHGIVSPAYCVFRINKNLVFPKYLHYLHRTKLYTGIFETASTGVIKSRLRLYPDNYLALTSALPTPEEQHQIARFLDWKTSQITKFIKAKKRLIELLKEQKQVIINDAVTGKIDVRTGKPYPKYKDSDVEWLGMVPEEWEVLLVRQITKYVKTGGTPKNASDKHFSENGFNWFTPGDFSESLYITNAERKLSELGLQEVTVFPKGSVLMIGIGATIGKSSICLDEASCNQQINVLIPNGKISNLFLVYILRLLKPYILECGKFTTLPILNQDDTKKLKVPLPKIAIQELIINYLNRRLSIIDNFILKIEEEIKLLNEYRTRLIADIVTGKVDVRDVVVPENAINANDAMDEETDENDIEEIEEQAVYE